MKRAIVIATITVVGCLAAGYSEIKLLKFMDSRFGFEWTMRGLGIILLVSIWFTVFFVVKHE